MPLSLTCRCGAKLEIDDKFAGKVITCPDCQKELATGPQPTQAAMTSGFALAGLVLALIGQGTLIAPLLAVGCGMLGLRHIRRNPLEVGGERYAWAGIILGGLFACQSVTAYFAPDLRWIDGIFREIEWARKLEYPKDLQETVGDDLFKITITRTRPVWGKTSQRLDPKFTPADDLILVDPWEDAYVVCLIENYEHEKANEDFDTLLKRARSRFLESELVHSLAATGTRKDEVKFEEHDKKLDAETPGAQICEMLIDLNLATGPRTFLLRVIKIKIEEQSKLFIVAGGTRSSRFGRMEPELREIVGSATKP